MQQGRYVLKLDDVAKNSNTDIPCFVQVTIFFDQKGFGHEDAESFFKEYSARHWTGTKGIPVKNWRGKALDWMWRRQKNRPYLRSKSKLMTP
ncbi:hypothetical protein [Albibacterium bauzanense]|uniref:Uncharacterized protein n=1 Tax=Albibacterium bauzanense TaxID=653929 RepID=A0A4R1LUR4_9SPHI|nr:hypothetical protein [Albibacterium bauzanense]TCK80913.1 hypothetical protein C8N28_2668 [Albibacterium bauzanense]